MTQQLLFDDRRGPDFRSWRRCRDAAGRMGWEKPGLNRQEAWWHWTTFEQLPEAGSISHEIMKTGGPATQCGGAVPMEMPARPTTNSVSTTEGVIK